MVARVVVMVVVKVEPMVMAAVKVETVSWAGQVCPSGCACWHVFWLRLRERERLRERRRVLARALRRRLRRVLW